MDRDPLAPAARRPARRRSRGAALVFVLAILAVFVAGTFLMRSAGCAINDAADFRYDARVKRTAQRVVAQGLVSPR